MANIIEDGSYVLAADTEELKSFEQELESAYLVGEWQIPRRPQPEPGGVPHIWKWDFMVNMMRQAGEVLGLEEGGRRSLLFTNPAIPTKGTTLSLRVGLQMLRPREVAWAHRHSMGALRFVARGNPKAYTIVDGEKLHMEENDLILTPQRTWHHHENPSDEPVIWLDAIDTPFVRNINAIFYEQYSDMKQPVVDASDSVQLDAGWTRPRWRSVDAERGLAVAYKWSSTYDQLKRLARKEGSAYDGVILDYVNPITGGRPPNHGLPRPDVARRRRNQNTPPYLRGSLLCNSGRRRDRRGRSRASLVQGRRLCRAKLVPTPPQKSHSRRRPAIQRERRAAAEGSSALSRRGRELAARPRPTIGVYALSADLSECRQERRSGYR